MSTELIRKHKILPFLNGGTSANPEWVQIKKATEYTRSLNPVSEDREYISDEMPTTELTGYKPSSTFTVTTIKGENDFELLYDMYQKLAVGEDAKKELLIVNVFDSSTVGTTSYYRAIKSNATILMSEWNISGNTLSCEVHENGTPVNGYVTISDGVPTFTAGDMPETSTKVATPASSVESGTYSTTQSVTLSCETASATIYYTTNGMTPTEESTEYTSAISVNETTCIRAIAVKTGLADSDVLNVEITIE